MKQLTPTQIHLWDQAKASMETGYTRIRDLYYILLVKYNGDKDLAMRQMLLDLSDMVDLDGMDAKQKKAMHNFIGVFIYALVKAEDRR
jgi:hypothetical protein